MATAGMAHERLVEVEADERSSRIVGLSGRRRRFVGVTLIRCC